MNQLWTVARFPNGEWTTGGRPDDPAYSESRVYQVWAADRKEAKRKAQYQARKEPRPC